MDVNLEDASSSHSMAKDMQTVLLSSRAAEHVQRKSSRTKEERKKRERQKKRRERGKSELCLSYSILLYRTFWLECAMRAQDTSACEILWFPFCFSYGKTSCVVVLLCAHCLDLCVCVLCAPWIVFLPSSSNKLSYMSDCHALNACEKCNDETLLCYTSPVIVHTARPPSDMCTRHSERNWMLRVDAHCTHTHTLTLASACQHARSKYKTT